VSEDESVLSRSSPPPDDVIAYGSHADAIADVRYASRGGERPLVVLVHGGFWRPTYDRAHVGSMAAALVDAGWTTVALEYRRAPGLPDLTVDDVRAGTQRLPGLVGGHAGRAVLVGHSAGGHLALWAATLGGGAVAAVVGLAPVADLALAERLALGSGAVAAFLGAAASSRVDLDPALLPDPEVPVALVHGEEDAIVPPDLSRAYRERHPAVRLVEIPRTGHFALIDPLSEAWPVVVETIRGLPLP
jgi:acetyl esterase/lipase